MFTYSFLINNIENITINYSNLAHKAYSYLLVNSRLANKKNCNRSGYGFAKQSNYYIYNSILFNFYKKNLNKNKLLFLTNNVRSDKNDISSINLANNHINFGKLTWYWTFKTMSQNRFLLYYKEYKNFFSKNFFINYEISLLNYEKNYNKWHKETNTGIKKVKLMPFVSKIKRSLKKLYILRLKVDRSYKFSKYVMGDEIRYLTNPGLLKDDSYLKYFRKPVIKELYKSKVHKKFWKTKKYRIFGLKSWKTSVKKKYKNFIKVPHNKKLKTSIVSSFNLIGKKNYKLRKSIWRLELARSVYYKSISGSFTRKNLLTNIKGIVGKKSYKVFFENKNKDKLAKLHTSYIFPKNTIEMSRMGDFGTILFNNNKKIVKTNSVSKIKTNKNSIYGFMGNNTNGKIFRFYKTKKYKLDTRTAPLKNKQKQTLGIFGSLKKNKIIGYIQNKLFFKKIEKAPISKANRLISKNKTFSSLKKTNKLNVSILEKTAITRNLNNNKIFVNFYYNSRIQTRLRLNNTIANVAFIRFNLNKGRLNQVITNIFIKNSICTSYAEYMLRSRLSNLKFSNMRFKYIKFLIKLNNYNGLRMLRSLRNTTRKNMSKKKKNLDIKENYCLNLKKNSIGENQKYLLIVLLL